MIIHAILYSWPAVQDRAALIAAELRGHADRVSVVHSGDNPLQAIDGVEVVNLDNRAYFGAQFQKTLEVFNGDVLLQVAADAETRSWAQIASRCRRQFELRPSLGIWAPEIQGTYWSTDRVFLFNTDDPALLGVVQTDCIVWAIRADVISHLKRFDHSANRLGWGIDWAAIAYAYANKWLVLRDTSLTVVHPVGSNYGYGEASDGYYEFMAAFDEPERIQYLLLYGYSAARKAGLDPLELAVRRS